MAAALIILGALAMTAGAAIVAVPFGLMVGGGLALLAGVDLTRRGEAP